MSRQRMRELGWRIVLVVILALMAALAMGLFGSCDLLLLYLAGASAT